MAYGDFKDLPRKTASEKVLRDRAFHIDKNPKFDGYQRGLAPLVYKRLLALILQMVLLKVKLYKTKN